MRTPEIDLESAVVIIDTKIVNDSYKNKQIYLNTKIKNRTGKIVAQASTPVTMYGQSVEKVRQRVAVLSPDLWDCDTPNLYTSEITLADDEMTIEELTQRFGIRKLQLSAAKGLQINGKQVKLRGTCLHHDNGIIGANTLKRAEQRRCEQLKAAGFNAIRSSHNPMSKAMLEVCDELGILVLDELTDVWNHSKNINDFSNFFDSSWEEEIEKMVEKDFNHPSVIIYSLGNEIPEAGTSKGAQQNRKMVNKVRTLDDTRYITNGINGILALGEKIKVVIGDLMKNNSQIKMSAKKDATDGSNKLNSMMSIMMGDFADAIATHPLMDKALNETVETMDIAGYNYLTGRHEREHEMYPNRVVLGTETFPADIANLWRIVTQNNHVLGDMTWTGYDYLGEAAVAVFHYDGQVNFNPRFPDRTAYCGDIDLIGYRRPISYYREIVYGLRKQPYIGVERLNHYGEKSSLTPWMWKDNIASWTWPGFEGKPAIVNVCSDAREVELLLNGKSLGKKPAGKDNKFIANFEITYEPGELKAIAYRDGKPSETFFLQTAQKEVQINPAVD
ncbi:MAG: glycoside hydrolase family 2 TIM barrel-domain containing protein, partial [Liquorilactobacillus ghanensis]|uniref:glycoside hydrolase family 2 TIM barrel-domain containing protein n=1 Tax=Liquorilactobacillus ghanensis TaxID=399370 RepID=UPI0039ECF134